MDFKKIMNFFLNPIQNHYADFNGRATREEFWMFVAVYMAIYIVLVVLGLGTIAMLYSLALLVPSLAIGARRLHDTNLTGWIQLVGIIPILGLIILIVLMVREGDKGSNQYGAPAGGPASAASVATPVATDGGDSSNPAS
jgi:uncharacterized membrane protein YhaH (DUF805 family)